MVDLIDSVKGVAKFGLDYWYKNIVKTNITIIMYHAVIKRPLSLWNWAFLDEISFSKQMIYLKKYFDIIKLSDVVEHLNSSKKRPAAIITFDDGYQNNYDIAFPILQQENIPATIFLTSGKINTHDTIPVCQVHNAFEKTREPQLTWNSSSYKLFSDRNKIKSLGSIKDQLKQMSNFQMKNNIKNIISKLGSVPDSLIEKDSPFRMLDHKSIKKMLNSELIDFGAHTVSHAILSRIPHEKQKEEIRQSINAVKKITGKPCKIFAYPNGMIGDYTEDTIKILQSMGINIAVTANEGINRKTTSSLELLRYGVGANKSFLSFICNVYNIKQFLREKLLTS